MYGPLSDLVWAYGPLSDVLDDVGYMNYARHHDTYHHLFLIRLLQNHHCPSLVIEQQDIFMSENLYHYCRIISNHYSHSLIAFISTPSITQHLPQTFLHKLNPKHTIKLKKYMKV